MLRPTERQYASCLHPGPTPRDLENRREGEEGSITTQLDTAPCDSGTTSRGALVERLVEHSSQARIRSKRVAGPDPGTSGTDASGTDERVRRLVAGLIEEAEKRLLSRVAEVLAEAEIATQQIVERSFSAAAALERSARARMEQDIEDIQATLAEAGSRTLEEFDALRILLMRTYETLSTLERVLRGVPPAHDSDGRETEESAMPAVGVPVARG